MAAWELWCSRGDGRLKRLSELAGSHMVVAEQYWHPVARCMTCLLCLFSHLFFFFLIFQQFGKILDVEIIFNERGSKVKISFYYYFFHKKSICKGFGASALFELFSASVRLPSGLRFCNIWVERWCGEGQREASRYTGGRTKNRGNSSSLPPTPSLNVRLSVCLKKALIFSHVSPPCLTIEFLLVVFFCCCRCRRRCFLFEFFCPRGFF